MGGYQHIYHWERPQGPVQPAAVHLTSNLAEALTQNHNQIVCVLSLSLISSCEYTQVSKHIYFSLLYMRQCYRKQRETLHFNDNRNTFFSQLLIQPCSVVYLGLVANDIFLCRVLNFTTIETLLNIFKKISFFYNSFIVSNPHLQLPTLCCCMLCNGLKSSSSSHFSAPKIENGSKLDKIIAKAYHIEIVL